MDDVLIVDKYQDIEITNSLPSASTSVEEKNRIVLKVEEKKGSGAVLEGSFHTYSRSPRKVGEFHKGESFHSRFTINQNGAYEVPDRYIMPNLRSLPTLPEHPLRKGEEWKASALETMDFGDTKLKIPLQVSYAYRGESPLPSAAREKLPEGFQLPEKGEQISYTYKYFHKPTPSGGPIRAVSGVSRDELWFDRKSGIPVYDRNRLSYLFVYADGTREQFTYTIDSWYKKERRTTEKEKEKATEEIKKDLKEKDSVKVRETEEGVALDLNNILFEYNSATLTDGARDALKKVALTLKKYPDREIRISGHTDSVGSDRYNQALSEKRARAVLKELRKHGVNGDNLSYKGYGKTKPIAPNDTPEGREKNRRVEILIVME